MAAESVAEFARRHNVCVQTVHNWRRRGLIVMTPGFAIDGDASDERLAERPSVYRGGKLGGNPPRNGNGHSNGNSDDEPDLTMTSALLRKESALARLRELELARESGEVVSVQDAVTQLAGTLALVRSHLLRLGQIISSRAPSCSSPAHLKEMIDREVSDMMNELFNYDGEVDLGEPDKKAARIIKKKFLGQSSTGI